MKNNSSQNLRFIVQLISLLLVIWIGIEFIIFIRYCESNGAGFFVSRPPGVEGFLPISALMSVYYFLQTGIISKIHPAGFFILISIVLVSLVLKKSFCSWLCPIGLISESLGEIGKKLFGKYFKIIKWFDYPLRAIKYLLLLFFIYSILSLDITNLDIFLNSSYNKLADIKMLFFFENASSFTIKVLFILVILSVILRGFWCRYLCPYGALLGFISFLSPFKVTRNKITCTNCKACTKICPSSINVHQKDRVLSDECTSCYECIRVCPEKDTLNYSTKKQKYSLSPKTFVLMLLVIYFSILGYAKITHNWNNNISVDEYIYHINHINSNNYTHPGGFSK